MIQNTFFWGDKVSGSKPQVNAPVDDEQQIHASHKNNNVKI